MSELQNDGEEAIIDEVDAQDEQNAESVNDQTDESSELAPDSADEREENTEPQEPDWVKDRIAKQTFKQRQAERERDEALKRIQEMEEKYVNKPLEPVNIPPIPDSWDDDYESKIKARDEAILRQAKYEAAQAQRREAEAQKQRDEERRQYEEAQRIADNFEQNAKKLGVDRQLLSEAEQKLQDNGITSDLAAVILDDPEGALIAMHLAANPLELYDLIDLTKAGDQRSLIKAGTLFSNIKSKASNLKPKPSSAPDPATTLKGGVVPAKERGPKGATFE